MNNLALQLDALKAAGCDKIYEDRGVSGAVIERNGLDRVLAETGRVTFWWWSGSLKKARANKA